MKTAINYHLTHTVFAALASVLFLVSVNTSQAAIFAKYDGIDGESKDASHENWIDVLSVDWGMNKPGGGATGQSRRRGAAVVEDVVLTIEYEKSSPKLQEACLQGKVIPKLEIEQTANYGGSRQTYLKHEFKNVRITSYSMSASGYDEGPQVVIVACSFEEVKVTYIEFDDEGQRLGNVEYSWKVEEGTR